MTRVYGNIQSLKSLKSELQSKGVTKFNSVGEINRFLSNFNRELKTVLDDEAEQLEKEYTEASERLEVNKKCYSERSELESIRIANRISALKAKVQGIQLDKMNYLSRILFWIKLQLVKQKLKYLIKNESQIIDSAVKEISKQIEEDENFIHEYNSSRKELIKSRSETKISRLKYTRSVIEGASNLISGAIGESLVVKEIKKLSDDYVLINDFNLTFSRPVYYKKQNQRIYSIQVDHLLISKAGIFIIETKNWSKSSIDSLSLRSPIEQIRRSSFALFIYISNNLKLKDHHWGEQQVPIRNLIVMINNKPKGKFKHVSIKLLSELNTYLEYFEPVLTDSQVSRIASKLI